MYQSCGKYTVYSQLSLMKGTRRGVEVVGVEIVDEGGGFCGILGTGWGEAGEGVLQPAAG